MPQITEQWQKCLLLISKQISGADYEKWFAPVVALEYNDGNLLLQMPSNYYIEHIEQNFIHELAKAIYIVFGKNTQLRYKIAIADESTSMTSKKQPGDEQLKKRRYVNPYQTQDDIPPIDPQLNGSYSFNSFVEGTGNKLARMAGLAIAKKPGQTAYNPLFIYGHSGCGKTHLANAIGLQAKANFPNMRVLYLTTNTFMTQYTTATRENTRDDFLGFYQTIDLLILDDVHDLAGKTATQNTFFHIFNHLHQLGKQLILTCDRPPMEIQGLEERLLTRFNWGLLAEIQQPDFELRKSILKWRIERDGMEVTDDVVDFIAENVTDNIRDLEGVLVSMMAHSAITDAPIDIELAKQVVGRITKIQPRVISVEHVLDCVCNNFHIEREEVRTTSRKRDVCQARQIAMYLAKRLTNSSVTEIGRTIGNRDHATVLHACKVVDDLMAVDKNYKQTVTLLEKQIKKK